MINIFHQSDEHDAFFASASRDGQQQLFDPKERRRPKVEYRADGRREVDGEMEGGEQSAGELWKQTLVFSAATRWKAKTEDNEGPLPPVQRAKRYLSSLPRKLSALPSHPRFLPTALLVLVNLTLLYFLYRLL